MNTLPVPTNTAAALTPAGPNPARLVAAFLSGKAERTLRAYADDLAHFATFCGQPTAPLAAAALLSRGQGGANELALAWRAELLERGLSPATVNRRLAALRSLVTLARTLGLVAWSLDVVSVRSTPYRDTRGPGRAGFRALLELVDQNPSPKGRRDLVVLRLLWDLALRREEVVTLDLAHLDLTAGTLSIRGKGRREREALTLPAATRAALVAWLAVRGDEPGALVVNVDRRTKGQRLTGAGLYYLVQRLGRRAGLPTVRPHGLRHAAITEALELTRGDVRRVQRFSRHRDLRTLTLYDDARTDPAGEVAALVAAAG